MRILLIVVTLVASLAAAQEDPWKTLVLGDRVQVTFRGGNMIVGQIATKPGDPKVKVAVVDYSKAQEVTINLSLEYPGLNGTMTILKKEIKAIRKLQALDAAMIRRLEEERAKYNQSLAAEEEARKSAEVKREQEGQADLEAQRKQKEDAAVAGAEQDALNKEAGRIKQWLAILNRFPPSSWGPERITEIMNKTQARLPVTQDEREFMENQVLWNEALAYSQKAPK
jgi:hypothetical protein